MTMVLRESLLGRVVVWLALVGILGVVVRGQAQDDPKASPDGKEEASPEEVKKNLEGAENVVLQTTDGVYLNANVWVPKNSTKETPIIILTHMLGRSQTDWFPFAKYLSEQGFAVCTFDFRGHGDSRDVDPVIYKPAAEAMKLASEKADGLRQRVIPQGSKDRDKSPPSAEKTEKINADEFKTGPELAFAMVEDLRAIKGMLLTRHNQGQFNIRRLGIVGAELGAIVALEWMKEDEYRQGRPRGWDPVGGDLAALVLLSPQLNYKGHKLATEFGELADEVSIMLVSGNDKKAMAEAEKVARKLRVPEQRSLSGEEKGGKAKVKPRGKGRPGSGWFTVDSKLMGSELMRPPTDKLDQYIGGFLQSTLSDDKARNWQQREVDPDRAGFGSG